MAYELRRNIERNNTELERFGLKAPKKVCCSSLDQDPKPVDPKPTDIKSNKGTLPTAFIGKYSYPLTLGDLQKEQ